MARVKGLTRVVGVSYVGCHEIPLWRRAYRCGAGSLGEGAAGSGGLIETG
jgi:hypothetical protein